MRVHYDSMRFGAALDVNAKYSRAYANGPDLHCCMYVHGYCCCSSMKIIPPLRSSMQPLSTWMRLQVLAHARHQFLRLYRSPCQQLAQCCPQPKHLKATDVGKCKSRSPDPQTLCCTSSGCVHAHSPATKRPSGCCHYLHNHLLAPQAQAC